MRQHYNTLLVKMLEKNSATLKPTFPLEISLVGITTQGVSLLPYELRSFTLFSFCKYIPSPFLFCFHCKSFLPLPATTYPLGLYVTVTPAWCNIVPSTYIYIYTCMHYISCVTTFQRMTETINGD